MLLKKHYCNYGEYATIRNQAVEGEKKVLNSRRSMIMNTNCRLDNLTHQCYRTCNCGDDPQTLVTIQGVTDMKERRQKMNYAKCWALVISLIMVLMSFAGCSGETGGGETAALPADGELAVHFIDVGQADCTLLVSQGEAMLIDAGNQPDDDLIIDYLYDLGIDELKYVIFTHPHEDHIGSGEALLDYFDIGKIFMLDEYDDGIEGYLKRAIDAAGIDTQAPYPGDTAQLGECLITFVGPYEDYKDANDDSICAKVTHGQRSFLFTGDAGSSPEKVMVAAGNDLEADVFQAGHHGSSTSNSYIFLKAVNPEYAVISCGEDNMYGHPHDEALSRFNDVGAEIFRTDEQGTVIAISDGENITFNCEGKKPTRPHTDEQEEAKYIGNINSKKYHLPTCGGLPDEKNRTYFMSIEAAEDAGYDPCGNCRPDEN